MVKIYMTIINFDDIIGKKFNTIANNVFVYHILKTLLFLEKQTVVSQTY